MSDPPVERRFSALCRIVRAQHFAWREAVVRLVPEADAGRVVREMWAVTGRETARAYARRIERGRPLAPQVAAACVWSSRCMGEEADVEPGAGDEAFVRHRACPWLEAHRTANLIEECRPGCDAWFRATVDELGRILGARLRVETLESLPGGGASCLRRLWREDLPP